MSLSQKEVEHIAHLARIELTPEEGQEFEKELSTILEFVKKLNGVNTENVDPVTGGTSLENILRPDEQIDKSLEGKSAKLLEAVPEQKDGYIKVKTVFEQNSSF